MNQSTFRKIPFIIWMIVITVLAVIPHADDGIMVSTNFTVSGMEKHIAGYFVAVLLCYYAYGKKENKGQRTKRQRSEVGNQRAEVVFIFLSGLFIFLYSVALEVAQFYLPYRTFNVYDIVANGVGVLLFVAIWSYRLRYTDDKDKRVKRIRGLR